MRMLTLFVLLVAAACVTSSASVGEDQWRLDRGRDGVEVSTRAVEGWSIREIRATTRIPARLSAIVAVLCDVDATAELNDMVAEAKIVQRDSDTRYRIYQAMEMPWPISNRDIVNQRQIVQDASSLTVTITDVAIADGMPPRPGFVRMLKSRQVWTLTPNAGAGVLTELRVLTDPAGPIPASIVNAMAVDAPLDTLIALRRLAQSPKYADAKQAFIRVPADGHKS